MLIMVISSNYNYRVKITNINFNSYSFTNFINQSFVFCLFIYLFIYSLIFLNSLNLFLCLLKTHLLFNRLTRSKYNKICIFSSKHKLHLPSKQLGVVDLLSIFHWIFELNPYFLISKNVWIKLFYFLSVHERTNEYDYHILTSIKPTKFQFFLSFTFSFQKLVA